MTGAQIKSMVQAGLDTAGDGNPFPYILVTRGDRAPEDGAVYRTAFLMGGYTEADGLAYGIQEEKGSLREFLRTWLEEQKTVSPGGNPWT